MEQLTIYDKVNNIVAETIKELVEKESLEYREEKIYCNVTIDGPSGLSVGYMDNKGNFSSFGLKFKYVYVVSDGSYGKLATELFKKTIDEGYIAEYTKEIFEKFIKDIHRLLHDEQFEKERDYLSKELGGIVTPRFLSFYINSDYCGVNLRIFAY